MSLSVVSTIEKNKISSSAAFLVILDIEVINPDTGGLVETLYLVRNSEDITHRSQLYTAFGFDIDISKEAGTVPNISITAQDLTGVIRARMEQYGGGVGFNVRIAAINSAALDELPDVAEYFQVIAAKINDYVVSWTLGAENALSIKFPRRRQLRDRCTWKYKSAECGYAGGMPTCDYSLQGTNGCAAHSNALNFGGFPGIIASNIRYG